MGTNYYWYQEPPCQFCGRAFPARHIGKSSGGWCFALHVEPAEGIRDLPDWRELWMTPGSEIRNEYGEIMSAQDMERCVTKRSSPSDPHWSEEEYRRNHAEQGPHNLVRSLVDGLHCVAHGEGTWDCVTGEFS